MNYYYIPIRLREKRPKFGFGGWPIDRSQEHVYSRAEIDDHDWSRWGIVDNEDSDLLVIDVDLYKMDESTQEAIDTDWDGLLDKTRVVQSPNGGLHIYVRYYGDPGDLPGTVDHVDLKGPVKSGIALSPVGSDYELVQDKKPWPMTAGELLDLPVFTEPTNTQRPSGDSEWTRDTNGLKVYDVLPESEYPENQRVTHPYHGSGSKSNFMVNEGAKTWACWRNCAERPNGATVGNALHLIGMEHGIIECGDRLDSETRREIIDIAVEEGYFKGVSLIPKLDAFNPDDARRYARKHGVSWPTTDDVRDRLQSEIQRALEDRENVTIDAPTASGKSHTVATTPWTEHPEITGDEPVVQLHKTNKAKADAVAKSRAAEGVTAETLDGRHEACPVAGGDFDDRISVNGVPAGEWLDQMCNQHGIPFRLAHAELNRRNDQNADLPCNPECPASTQWDGVPRDDDGEPAADVIHATHPFGNVSGLIRNANVFIDEQPDFTEEFSTDRIRRMVTEYLQEVNAPVATWEELIQTAKSDDSDLNGYISVAAALSQRPDSDWYFENPNAHTLAPAITDAVWQAFHFREPDENGRIVGQGTHKPPEFGDHDDTSVSVSVVLDAETNDLRTVRVVPDFSISRTVVGLEERPHRHLWQLNTDLELDIARIMDYEEQTLWRRYERGLLTVQVGDSTRPLASGEFYNDGKTRRLIDRLRELHGDDFQTAITAKSVEARVESAMSGEGVEDPKTMHYRATQSRNDFAGEGVGLTVGSSEPGDGLLLDLCAELHLDATPETAECGYCDGDGCSECDDGEYRVVGREFEGPDAEAADLFLQAYREREVAQAAGRYARNADDPNDYAVVYCWTSAIPPGFADVKVPGDKLVPTEKQARILEYVRDNHEMTAADVAEATDTSKPHAIETLKQWDCIQGRDGAGDYGATLWRVIHGEDPFRSLTEGIESIYPDLTISAPEQPVDPGDSSSERTQWGELVAEQPAEALDPGG